MVWASRADEEESSIEYNDTQVNEVNRYKRRARMNVNDARSVGHDRVLWVNCVMICFFFF